MERAIRRAVVKRKDASYEVVRVTCYLVQPGGKLRKTYRSLLRKFEKEGYRETGREPDPTRPDRVVVQLEKELPRHRAAAER